MSPKKSKKAVSQLCDLCNCTVVDEEGISIQEAMDWHKAMEHSDEVVVKDEVVKINKPKDKKLTKAQKRAMEEAALAEMAVEVVDSTVEPVAVPEPPVTVYVAPAPMPENVKAPKDPTLADVRDMLKRLAGEMLQTAEDAHKQAKTDAAFFKEIDETEQLIRSVETDSLPVLLAIPEQYQDKEQIENMQKLVYGAKAKLAMMKADIRYVRGKTSAQEIMLMTQIREAQKAASEHNADINNEAAKRAQEWVDREMLRFQRMLAGEIYVPRKKDEAISFMHDTIWKLNGTLKAKRGEKWYIDLRPEDVREVWAEVFEYQMQRYRFEEMREFSYVGKKASVDDKGVMTLGASETFTEVAELPFDAWSTKMLNICLKVQKQNRGKNLLEVLERHGLQGKDGVEPEVLGRRYLGFASDKPREPKTAMEAALVAAGVADAQ